MTTFFTDHDVTLYAGDIRDGISEVADGSVQCVVTSPPYWGLRDYGDPRQIGHEPSPADYVAALVTVFRDVRRVLADDGVMWLNLGDTYASKARGTDAGWDKSRLTNPGNVQKAQAASLRRTGERHRGKSAGIAEKNLIGVPWRVAFGLQDDGWVLRKDVIWRKTNPMPESVTDRPSSAHEHVFLLTKSTRYYFDLDAIRAPHKRTWVPGANGGRRDTAGGSYDRGDHLNVGLADAAPHPLGGNPGDVWDIATQPYPGAHFAVMPRELARRCIVSGSREGDVVFDPFTGSGTTGMVARQTGRRFVGLELNPAYLDLAVERLGQPTLNLHGTSL